MSKHENASPVRGHIDGRQYESPNPTTGAALYALGQIEAGLELYRGDPGAGDEWPVENEVEVVHLKDNDHFHSDRPKPFTIYVNGEQKEVSAKTLTFEDLVKVAFPVPPTGTNILFTISYESGPSDNHEGSLTVGGSIKVKKGMVFNVIATDKS